MCAGAAADQAGLAEAGHHPLEAGAQHLGGLLGGARGGQAGGQDVGGPGPGAASAVLLLFQMVYKSPSCLQALRQNSQAQLYSDQGLGPRLLGTFSHGHVTPYLAPCADLSLLHQPAIYPLVAARVGSLHRWGQ